MRSQIIHSHHPIMIILHIIQTKQCLYLKLFITKQRLSKLHNKWEKKYEISLALDLQYQTYTDTFNNDHHHTVIMFKEKVQNSLI